jgi:hypothetical protein
MSKRNTSKSAAKADTGKNRKVNRKKLAREVAADLTATPAPDDDVSDRYYLVPGIVYDVAKSVAAIDILEEIRVGGRLLDRADELREKFDIGSAMLLAVSPRLTLEQANQVKKQLGIK